MKTDFIYIAGGLFNAETNFMNAYITEFFEKKGYNCFLPQRDGFEVAKFVDFLNTDKTIKGLTPELAAEIGHFVPYFLDLGFFMSNSSIVLANLDEPIDDGMVVEMSYAKFADIPIIGFRTDIRTPFGNVKDALAINPFPVQQCDVFIRMPLPAGVYDEVLKTADKITETLNKYLEELIPTKKNKMKDSKDPIFKNIVKGSELLFHDIKDRHTIDNMKKIAERYIQNKDFFQSVSPKVIDLNT